MADDSEEKDQAQPEKPAGPTSIIVRTPFGGTREALKGPDGKFVAKTKPATKKDIQEVVTEFLTTKYERGVDGKLTKRSKTRILEQMEAMHKLALDTDPKVAPARTKAVELLWVYAFGKPSASDKDRAAMELAGVKYVVIQPPDNMMNPEVVNADAPKPELKPAWADAEVVSTDEPPKE